MAQSAESALIVRMEATLKKFEAQMAKAQGLTNRTAKGMEDRMATMNRNIARNAERAGEAIGRAGGRTMMIQNASFQLQDFAVQVAAGTSASQALGQQLPQLLGGFGAFGAAAGAAVAILGPLVGSLFETGASAGDASAALKRLSDATDGLRSMTEMSSEDIIKRYGAITEELELVLNKKQELAEFEAREAARGAISGLADNGIISAAAQVRELQQRLAEYEAMSVDEARALGIGVADNILLANESIGVITESLGLTVEEIYRVSDALEAWSSANSLYEQADAASAVLAAISGTSLETSEWGKSLADAALQLYATRDAAADALVSMDKIRAAAAALLDSVPGSDWLDDAIKSAAGLAATLWDAAKAKAAATDAPVVTDDRREAILENRAGVNEARGIRLERTQSAWLDAGKSTGGGRGGKAASKDDYAAAVERLQQQIEAFTLEAEAVSASADSHLKYGDAADYAKKKAELLIAAQKEGKAVTPELSAEIEKQAAAYAEAAQRAEDARDKISAMQQQAARGRDALGDVFGAILEGSDAAKQALANLLMEIAKIQMQKAGLGLIDAAGGGGIVSWLGGLLSFDGGGYTGKGGRSGGLDGKGGFPALLHPNETVIDHTKAASAQPQGLVVTAYSDEGVILRVARQAARGEVQGAAPTIVRQSVSATGRAMASTKKFGRII
ncbi:hypothetical protein GCM10011452_09170 [Gemmobacter lanyuensis]|uniref:Bacteriophage tail tape measure N-terminal domain-containing protein n=1 Tax=Gemmobacter lanyuensis TaxID=1054497 RepID=A0A918INA1_9RHOB|nr:hypothetical protein [Gemmobacter lanyuensis]GGW23965.1 hypothetical protein GCM10011452_09170 [Gemmobacter lanyuensis]